MHFDDIKKKNANFFYAENLLNALKV